MAKRKKKNTPDRFITVDSKAYGSHQRAARGTYKPATLNPAMKRSADQTVLLNTIAKSIKDPFDQFREGVKDGTMWHRLLSIVKLELRKYGKFNFAMLNDFEFDSRCKLSSLFAIGYDIIIAKSEPKMLKITTSLACKLGLQRDKADSYRLTLIVWFSGSHKTDTVSECFITPLKSRVVCENVMTVPIPKGATVGVVAIKCEFLQGGYKVSIKNRRAMQVIAVSDLTGSSSHAISL